MTNRPKIIGITGNIATGKSVVGHMLANSGGLEIDADVVANRMLYPSGPAYDPVIEAFGDEILTADGMIARDRLGKIVFSNLEKLQKLEALIHPAVTSAIHARIKITRQPFVVIEAIKLLESSLVDICDAIWVSHASVDHQMERLLKSRNLTREQAESRIQGQPSQSEKLKRANVVINTKGSFQETWQQVQKALNDTIQLNNGQNDIQPSSTRDRGLLYSKALTNEELANFWQTQADEDLENLYESLGSNIATPIMKGNRLKSLLFWDNWNFTAAPCKWIEQQSMRFSSGFLFDNLIEHVMKQECEVILFTDQMVNQFDFAPEVFGFNYLKINELTYPAWQEAARKVASDQNEEIWIKILSQPLEIIRLNNLETNDL